MDDNLYYALVGINKNGDVEVSRVFTSDYLSLEQIEYWADVALSESSSYVEVCIACEIENIKRVSD